MPEPSQVVFSYKEVVEALIKVQGIHTGIWGLFFKFGLQGMNVGASPDDVRPAALVPIMEIGLQKFDKENSISVNAAKVNPPKRKPNPKQ